MKLGVGAFVVGDEIVSGDIEVDDGIVTAVGLPAGDQGLTVVPGFIDVHFHGHAGIEFADSTIEQHKDLARLITSTGVTAYQPTLWTMRLEETIRALGRHPGGLEDGARVLGFHLEGPFLAPEKVGAHQPELLLSPKPEIARQYLDAGPVDQVTIAPELEGALDTIEYLAREGVTVSLGHSVASSRETELALDAGAVAFTHVFNAMRPFDHRDPGILGNALGGGRGYLTAIFDGVHFSDEAALALIRCAGDRLLAITDGTAATGSNSKSVVLGGQECLIVDGAPRHADGTIAGSILTMDAALRKLVSLGVSLPEASRAVSTNPARLSGRDDLGTITVGKPADLVVLDEALEVKRTLVGGVEVFRSN